MHSPESSPRTILFWFTAEYPYGVNEPFVATEAAYLSQAFDELHIFPYGYHRYESAHWQPPANANIFRRPLAHRYYGMLMRYPGLVLRMLWTELRGCDRKRYFLRRLKLWTGLVCDAIRDSEFMLQQLEQFRGQGCRIMLYSFWMNEWALALSALKLRGLIPEFVFGSAGFDIYDSHHPGNYLPFRYLNYSQARQIYPNTRLGGEYMKAKGMFPEKITYRHWGTFDRGLNPFDPGCRFTVLSCSKVIPRKRVHLIAEILRHVPVETDWIHLGDGVSMEALREAVATLPPHIHAHLQGWLPMEQIFAWYREHPAHLFILTSENEGLPVAVTEAISFGLPVMATDVAGNSEAVTPETGMLLPKDFDPAEAARMLMSFRDSELNTAAGRARIRAFWEAHFQADVNLHRFAEELAAAASPY